MQTMLEGLTPEYQLAINDICKDAAVKVLSEVGDNKNWSLTGLSTSIKIFHNLILEEATKFEGKSFLICIAPDNDDSGDFLGEVNIDNFLSYEFNIFVVNRSIQLINQFKLGKNVNKTNAGNYSKNNPDYIVLQIENGVSYCIWYNGYLLEDRDLKNPELETPKRSRFTLDATQYKEAIKQCYEKEFRFSGGINTIWKDKKERILKHGSTEALFHDPLHKWLNLHLSSAKVVGNVKKISDDETDIEIVSLRNGNTYIIEVKWTGTNGKSSPSLSKIKDAFIQVKNYIEQEEHLTEACLVNFDGRDIDKFNELEHIEEKPRNWKIIKKCQEEEFPDNAIGIVFFLENETASKRGQ